MKYRAKRPDAPAYLCPYCSARLVYDSTEYFESEHGGGERVTDEYDCVPCQRHFQRTVRDRVAIPPSQEYWVMTWQKERTELPVEQRPRREGGA